MFLSARRIEEIKQNDTTGVCEYPYLWNQAGCLLFHFLETQDSQIAIE